MTEQPADIDLAALKYPSVLYATGLGSGLLPKAPGTWGSVLGVGLWCCGVGSLSLLAAVVLLVVMFVLGLVAIRAMQQRFGVMDAPEIVIDEILGVWVALLFVPLTLDSWWIVALGFGAFRLFDIYKPWPVSWADQMHTPIGVMLDDLLAGGLALAVVQIAVLWVERVTT